MTTPPNTKIEALFFESRERPAAERMAYLKKACGEDQALFDAVRDLLDAADAENSLLDGGVEIAETAAVSNHREGATIGRYKLLQQVGEGGFGNVYMAEQMEPVNRQVALKIIKPGMDSQAVVARFEVERQALAMMDHPNIAKVLDGGATPEGRPYFVMELVRGVSITEFCDRRRLKARDRLELFVDVCNAVQHAHQKGIIHRDIKPSNVMITLHDGNPVVKVIDFGVVRAIHQKLTDKTLFTRYGQMIGTPQYMSPEQADMSGLDVDTRSDIYSLGVLLYELLTGSPPIKREELEEAGFAEIRRMICEHELVKPSTRISETGEQQLSEIADHRSVTADDLRYQFQGDLDWVVMKTLEKERDRRYATANDLAADVVRYLNDEAVVARPPSVGYRLRKYVRRHRLAVTTAAGVLLTLLIATVVSCGLAAWAIGQKKVALEQMRFAEEQEQIASDRLVEVRQQRNEKDAALTKLDEQAQVLEWQVYHSKVLQVQALAESNLSATRETLSECPTALREWEWNRLNAVMSNSALIGEVPATHRAFFPSESNRFMAFGTGDNANKIRTWDAQTLECIAEIGVDGMRLQSNARHPNGHMMAVGSPEGGIATVDLSNGRLLWKHKQVHARNVDGLSFSPDGERLASICWGGELRIWNARTGEELARKSGLGELFEVEYDPSGRYIATGSGEANGPARIWDAKSYELLHKFDHYGHGIWSVSFSPDGKRLACGGRGGRLSLRNIQDGSFSEIEVFLGPDDSNNGLSAVEFSPDGKWLAFATAESIMILDVGTGQLDRRLLREQGVIWWISFSPDNRFLTTMGLRAGNRYSTFVYDLADANLEAGGDQALSTSGDPSRYTAEFSPDGKLVATGGSGRVVEIFDVPSGNLVSCLKGHTNPIISVTWSNDGKTLFSHERGGLIHAWDWLRAKQLWKKRVTATSGRQPLPQQWYIGKMAIDRNDEHLFVGLAEGQIVQLDAADGEVGDCRNIHTADVNCVATSSDGRLLASASADKTVVISDAQSLRNLRTLTGHQDNVCWVAFSPDGQLVASTSVDKTTRIWDAETGIELHKLGKAAHSCAFSPSGNRLFSCGYGGVVVWDVTHGREMLRTDHRGRPIVAVSQDGKTISTVGFTMQLISGSPTTRDEQRIRRVFRDSRRVVADLVRQSVRVIDLLKLLEARNDLDVDVRRAAIHRIQITGDDPYRLFTSSWKNLVDSADDYERAADDAVKAFQLQPASAEYALAAGLGHLRMARYDKAVETLNHALNLEYLETMESWKDVPVDVRPGILAVLAMSNHQLGHEPLARQQLDEACKVGTSKKDRLELGSLLAEATAMIRTENIPE